MHYLRVLMDAAAAAECPSNTVTDVTDANMLVDWVFAMQERIHSLAEQLDNMSIETTRAECKSLRECVQDESPPPLLRVVSKNQMDSDMNARDRKIQDLWRRLEWAKDHPPAVAMPGDEKHGATVVTEDLANLQTGIVCLKQDIEFQPINSCEKHRIPCGETAQNVLHSEKQKKVCELQ